MRREKERERMREEEGRESAFSEHVAPTERETRKGGSEGDRGDISRVRRAKCASVVTSGIRGGAVPGPTRDTICTCACVRTHMRERVHAYACRDKRGRSTHVTDARACLRTAAGRGGRVESEYGVIRQRDDDGRKAKTRRRRQSDDEFRASEKSSRFSVVRNFHR